MTMWQRLWQDETGVVNSVDLILMGTILVLGVIVGLVSLRNQIVQELSDTANAIGALNQGYSYSARTLTLGSYSASVAGASYTDMPNVDATIDVTAHPPTTTNTPGED